MKINPYKLLKSELQIYLSGHCKHRMPYQQHPSCFVKEIQEGGKNKKVGVLDIEFDNFHADFGTILTYSIKEFGKNKYYESMITKEELNSPDFDKRIVSDLIRDINKFDEIITFYGTRCDIPYIRSRALYFNLDFPFYGFIKHKDVYYMVRYKLRLHRNSLDSVCRFFEISGKSHVEALLWRKARIGDKEALKKVLVHNRHDVKLTEKIYRKIVNYVRNTQRSL